MVVVGSAKEVVGLEAAAKEIKAAEGTSSGGGSYSYGSYGSY